MFGTWALYDDLLTVFSQDDSYKYEFNMHKSNLVDPHGWLELTWQGEKIDSDFLSYQD